MRRFTQVMTLTTSILVGLLVVGAYTVSDHAFAQRNEMPPGYPQSLEKDLQSLARSMCRTWVPSPSGGFGANRQEVYRSECTSCQSCRS